MKGWSIGLIAAGLIVARPIDAGACSVVMWPVPSPLTTAQQLTIDAEWIVRARAIEYAKPPSNPRIYTTGLPDSFVRFSVDEVVKGADVPRELTIPGYLSEVDDFNDHPPPYHFVRSNGRSGSCFANSYRRGAPFLLMLKQDGRGFTPYWGALEPVNEQLRSEDDDWITWVRSQVYEDSRTTPRLDPDRLTLTYSVYSAVIRAMRSGVISSGSTLPARLDIFGRTTRPVDWKPYREPGAPLPVSRELQTDFENSIVLQDPVIAKLDIGSPYQIVPVPRLQEEYRFPGNRSLLAFSQVGVDRAGTQAIVYFSYQCSRECGTGGYVVLRNRDGEWRVVQVIDAWKVPGERK